MTTLMVCLVDVHDQCLYVRNVVVLEGLQGVLEAYEFLQTEGKRMQRTLNLSHWWVLRISAGVIPEKDARLT